jgi:glycosyltransferase involved in cell wall biosynthesis
MNGQFVAFLSNSEATAAAMRIAFLTHYTELYGANLSLLGLIDGLRRFGHSCAVICPEHGDLLDALASRGVAAAVLPFAWWLNPRPTARGAAKRFLANLRRLPKLVEQITEWKSDLVYSNSSVFCVGALAAARLGLPHVWHIREFGDRDYDLVPDAGRNIFRRALLTADATIFVSQALKQAILGARTAQSAHVIYNGVASEAVFDERRRKAQALHRRRRPFTFVLVGRFRESKGQHIAIKAFAQVTKGHKDVRLLLVGGAGLTGDQSYLAMCRQRVQALRLADRIEFWGYIRDVERAYLAADAALMCSRNEAMGRVTVEAMSACRPVIGFESGGTPELIENDRTGLLYRGGPDALAEKMEIYIRAPDLAQSHGETAWQVARARYATEVYAAQIDEQLHDIRPCPRQ